MSSALDTDLQGLLIAAAHHAAGRDELATCEIFARSLPRNRAYLVAAGVDAATDAITGLGFDAEDLAALRALPHLRSVAASFFEWLTSYRFRGSILAVAEGTPVFAGEPILQITASLIEVSLFETIALATLTLATTAATKAARLAAAARGRDVVEFASRRAPGAEAPLAIARAAHLGGASHTSNVEASRRFGIPLAGAVSHAWVLAHDDEARAFARLLDAVPDADLIPLDTYDVERAARTLCALGRPIRGVRIDSGDLDAGARRGRAILDEHGHRGATITVSGELDEHRIEELVCGGAPIDRFGVGKQLATPADAPALGAVYKLVEIDGPDGVRRPAKRSPGKVSVAGRKQVLRWFDERGVARGDRLVAAGTPPAAGELALLEPVVERGVRVRVSEPLAVARARSAGALAALPPEVRRLAAPSAYPVAVEIEG